jgi:hypothetical protein
MLSIFIQDSAGTSHISAAEVPRTPAFITGLIVATFAKFGVAILFPLYSIYI